MLDIVFAASSGTPKDIEKALQSDPGSIDKIESDTNANALMAAAYCCNLVNVGYLLSKGADIYVKIGANRQNILSTAIGAINSCLHPEGKRWAKKENLETAITIFELLLKHEKEKYPEEMLMLDRKDKYRFTPMDDLRDLKKTDPDVAERLEKIIEKYHPGYVSAYYAAKMPKPKKASSSHKRASKENKAKASLRKSSKLTATKERESTSSSWFDYIGSFFSSSSPRSQGYEVIDADPSLKKPFPSSPVKAKID